MVCVNARLSEKPLPPRVDPAAPEPPNYANTTCPSCDAELARAQGGEQVSVVRERDPRLQGTRRADAPAARSRHACDGTGVGRPLPASGLTPPLRRAPDQLAGRPVTGGRIMFGMKVVPASPKRVVGLEELEPVTREIVLSILIARRNAEAARKLA
jgi:hypothetical protein